MDDASAPARSPPGRVAATVERAVGERTTTLLGDGNFRRLFLGRLVGQVGDKLFFVAAMWLVFELTGSTVFTGVAGFLSRAPQGIGFLFGPLVDRARLRRLLVAAELGQGVVALAVPVAALTGHLSVWVVLAVVAVLALGRRLTGPAEQAALPRIVDESLLPRANSVASSSNKAAGALAEAVSGTLIAVVGAVWLFALDAVTFLASAVAFGGMDIPETERTGERPSPGEYVADLRAGLAVVRESVVGHMVVAATLAGAFTGMATAVLPAFAETFGGAGTFGLLIASVTVGTLGGTLLASRLEGVGFGVVTAGGFVVAAAGRVGAAVVGWAPAVLALYGLAAVPVGAYNVLVSAVMQTGVPNDRLARVSSTTGSLVAVVAPLGLLAGGVLGGWLPPATVIGLSALGYLAIAAYWAGVPALRGFPAVVDVEPGSFAPEA